MKKYLFLAALGLVTLASCTSDDLVVQGPADNMGEETPIIFSSLSKGMTRADFTGADAAAKLGNKFVVSGKKGTSTASTTGNVVFNNYLVEYAENTANTTESNVANWEYVGKGRIKHAIDAGITKQTIKYWDYTAAQYDFIAWSAGEKTAIFEGTPADGEVLVSTLNPNATATAAVTFTGKAEDLAACYISDLVTVKKDGSTPTAYQEPVTLSFRQLGTKVRVAIYETIPGYSVKNVQFYSAAASNDANAAKAKLFSTSANEIYKEGTFTVTYPNVDKTSTDPEFADNNQAHVAFVGSGTQSTIVDWGGLNYTIAEDGESSKDKIYLGRSSNTASFAGKADDNYYVIFLPNETGTNLNLRVNYTLESIDGGSEEIVVKGATAQVPSIYTKWEPGYAYTYIFKISDKTNGYTGVYDPTKPDDTTVNSEPAGLYPITFDAVVVNAEDNDKVQETITTVSAPSITTYQKGSTVVNNNEYLASTGDIYVTVNDGNEATTPDLANGALQDLTGKAKLYKLSVAKTEAEVIDAIQIQDDDVASGTTIKGRNGLELTEKALTLTNTVEYGVDGNAIEIPVDGTKKKAAKFTPEAGTYAFVYTKTAATPANNVVKYEALNWDNFATGQTKYRYDYKAPAATDAQKGVKYFLRSGDTAPYTYTLQTPFIGQGVGNLYLDAAGNTIASGYAVTGTTYYYTTNKGMSYTAAHNVAYASDMLSGLYEEDTTPGTYKITTDTGLPTNGKAYYYKDGSDYIYCVFLPQQTTGWYELDTDKANIVLADEADEVVGQTYFDKFTQNDGVYYTKVIKVQ